MGLVQGPLLPSDCRKVQDLVTLGGWDMSSLSISLIDYVIDRIYSFPPPLVPFSEDLILPTFLTLYTPTKLAKAPGPTFLFLDKRTIRAVYGFLP